jgi:hypothetical protein
MAERPIIKRNKTVATSGGRTYRGDVEWFRDYGNGYAYNQDVSSMSAGQVENALSLFADKPDSKSGTAWNWYQKLLAQKQVNDHAAAMEEYQAAMLKMYSRMAEAAERPPVYQQPINDVSAANAYDKAERSTRDQQLMRRGILSLTRFGDNTRKRQTSGVA